jgi:hypothetical protein
VTATLVEQNRRRQGREEPVHAALDEISSRLEAIERRLDQRGPGRE